MDTLFSIIQNMLGANASLERFEKGSCIYQEGDPVEHVFIMINGRAKLINTLAGTKKEFIQHIIYPNEFMGLAEFIFRMKKRRMSAVAVDREVVMGKVPFFKFEMELRKNSRLADYIMAQLAKKGEGSWRRCFRRKHLSLKGVVIGALVDIALERGIKTEEGVAIEGLSHRDLAEYTGVCRQGTSTALNMLRRENKIAYGRKEILIKIKPLNHDNMLQRQLHP